MRRRMEWSAGFVCDTAHGCMMCNGFYGPNFGQPMCATCHAFLYAHCTGEGEECEPRLTSNEDVAEDAEEDVDRDSGNEEDDLALVQEQVQDANEVSDEAQNGDENEDEEEDQGQGEEGVEMDDDQDNNNQLDEEEEQIDQPLQAEGAVAELEAEVEAEENFQVNQENDLNGGPVAASGSIPVESLNVRLSLLCDHCSIASPTQSAQDQQVVHCLPPEVLTSIFVYLDDVSLRSAAHVCRRWQQVLLAYTSQHLWQDFTLRRWPLYKPLCKITDWFAVYSNLINSSFCLTCIYASHAHHNLVSMAHMADVMLDENHPLPLREKRLGHDIRGLLVDPPEGIRAQPLDSSSYRWQASITGPSGSVYEGGLFFLLVTVPFAYPFQPPEVRFITKIFHPNVSRHGDIGIDILHQSWAPGFTIPKVLISIQSLLTDPYTFVCMEPVIGALYNSDRKLFDAVARHWTRRHAMHDAIMPVLP